MLIKWNGKPIYEAMWEDAANISIQFPTFNLEDKAAFEGGGIVTDQREVSQWVERKSPQLKMYTIGESNGESEGE